MIDDNILRMCLAFLGLGLVVIGFWMKYINDKIRKIEQRLNEALK